MRKLRFYFICFFFIFFREREHTGKGRWRERILSMLHVQHRAQHGARSHNPEIMSQFEITSLTLNRLTHLGTLEA